MDIEPDQHRKITSTLAKVTIYEVAERPWGWLVTSAEVDDRVYI